MEPSARRNTRQRRMILEAVKRLSCHPTAEEVYDSVRKDLPGISLSTVYRNLGVLVDEGRIGAVTGDGRKVHYDHNINEHIHIVCSECGRICDVEGSPLNLDNLTPSQLSGYRLEEVNVNLVGICPACYDERPRKER